VGTIGAAADIGLDHETVVFQLGDASFGLAIERVRKVMKVTSILPCSRDGSPLCGLLKLKGRTIPVYDLGLILDAHRSKLTPKSRILVTEGENGEAAFVVDAVTHVRADAYAVVDAGPVLAEKHLI
jgi:chemotaxis signal transduction protein